MPIIDEDELAELSLRSGIVARYLIWVETYNRLTSQPENMGMWSGHGERDFVIDSETRTYRGPALVSLPAFSSSNSLVVREIPVRVTFSQPILGENMRVYDLRFSPVEIHQALFSHQTRELLAEPRRLFRGWIDQKNEKEAAEGGDAEQELVLVSSTRSLTLKRALYKSLSDHQEVSPTDTFRAYASNSTLREVRWGQADIRPSSGGDLLGDENVRGFEIFR